MLLQYVSQVGSAWGSEGTLTSLPDGIILKILQRCKTGDLVRSALVCKQWYRAAVHASLSSVHFNLKSKEQSREFAKWLSKRSSHLKSLSLKSWCQPPDAIPRCPSLLAALALSATQLQSLSLLGFDMRSTLHYAALQHLAPLTALRRLSLRSCGFYRLSTGDDSNFTDLLQLTVLKKLEHLDLAGNPIHGEAGLFRVLGRELSELTSLVVSNGPELCESALVDISKGIPRLKQLDLKEGIGLSPAAVVRSISVPCQKLGIQATTMEQQQLLGWLGMYGHHLEELVVVRNNGCFPAAVTSVLQSLAVQEVPATAEAASAAEVGAVVAGSAAAAQSLSCFPASLSVAGAAAGLHVHPVLAAAAGAAAAGGAAAPAGAATVAGGSRSAQLQLLRPLTQLRELEIRWHGPCNCRNQCIPFVQLTVLEGLTKLRAKMRQVDLMTLRTIAEIQTLRKLDFIGSRHVDDEEGEGRRRCGAVSGLKELTGLTRLTKLVLPGGWIEKEKVEDWRLEGRVATQLQQLIQSRV